ncbi:E3 ubiquitin/ISG15 ligase TRIM25-like [Mytilus edulis]|uniref:E3 ubiquitin/ISG15 ligase TRIM25-like n=1 Tax=Mytilus edulis TaxID=6550 RepID=UPI0039EEAB00
MASFILCEPCSHEGNTQNAEKWCTDCNEGFCHICEKAHKSLRITREHNLILIEDYRKIENVNVSIQCEEHGSKLELYCKAHEKAICIACLPTRHNVCSESIIPLAEAAKNAKTSTAVADLEYTINNTLVNIRTCLNEREAATERIEIQEKIIKKRIFDTRETINNHLDDLEGKLLNELTTTHTSCKSKYGTIQNQLKEIEKQTKRLQEQTFQLKRFAPDIQLFLSTHQMNKEIHDEVKSITKTLSSVRDYDIEIEIHQGITSLLKDVDYFGRIKIDESTTNCPFKDAKIDQAQIQVPTKQQVPTRRSIDSTKLKLRKKFKIEQKGREMYIAGCAILANGNLLFADNKGHSVLMEYNEEGHFIRDIPVSAQPWDMTVIDTDQIAVSYFLEYIEVIDLKKMAVLKTVKFKNNCRGISYSDGKIYVVVYDVGIVVLDMEGTILNTIKCDMSVYNITTIKERLYYTVPTSNTVYCCTTSTTRNNIWNLNDRSLNAPGGITTDSSQYLFVVGIHSNNLMIFQDDGKVSKTLLTEADGLDKPIRLYYNKKTNILLVCNQLNGYAFLYSVLFD